MQADLEKIGNCVSGPGGLTRPEDCEPGATCILGFGPDTNLMGQLCDPERTTIPDFSRAYCSGWADESVSIAYECIAKSHPSVTIFEVFDDEQDGDMDLRDINAFQEFYQVAPNQVQCDAILVALECCVPESVVRDIGRCLSGPVVHEFVGRPPRIISTPPPCNEDIRCTLGFSAPVELGDYLYRMCAAGLPIDPNASIGYCSSWEVAETQVVFECPANKAAGVTFFVVSDSDGDDDVDLFDFAAFQRGFDLP
ncbi:MAG: hypothetical protein Q7R41_02255 [Phycisphaerales bacterium]|nr:hypothetical protein [Phycisphaerales bacterium]